MDTIKNMMLQDEIEKQLQDDVNAINIMWNNKITKILMKENPTPQEELVQEAYRIGLLMGRHNTASQHNDMLNRAKYGADRVRYKKMLKEFLNRYFSYLG